MNHITKRNRLQEQINLYDAFLPFCPPESKFKLMEEMLRMRDEIQRIQTMTLRELQTPVFEYTITEKSTLNDENSSPIIKRPINRCRLAIKGALQHSA